MKKKIKILGLIFIFIIIFFACFKAIKVNTFKETVLYSEKDVKEYSSEVNKDKNYLTREEAIKKALNLFENGFGVDLNRDNLSENIVLRGASNNPSWNIIWSNKNNGSNYFCEISVDTGEIISAAVNPQSVMNGGKANYKVNKDEVFNIIKPLLKEINIKIDKNKSIIEDYNENRVIIRSKEGKEYYQIIVDYKNKKPIEFYRNIPLG